MHKKVLDITDEQHIDSRRRNRELGLDWLRKQISE